MRHQVCDCDPLDYCEHKQKWDKALIEAQKKAIQKEWVKAAGNVIEELRMAKYDYGGGCPCGLYKECDEGCIEYKGNKMLNKEREEYWDKQQALPINSMKRPWGDWEVLDVDQGYKVKRLSILPDQSISLQYHQHRSEHWTVVQGEGKVIVDGNIFTVKKGESFHVPKLALHKITNTHLTETLIAIEVQMGDICSEEDIVRC